MPSLYSYDLQHKAVEAVERSERKIDICHTFGFSRNTLHQRLTHKDKTIFVQAITHYQQGYDPNIIDWEQFRAFTLKHQGKTHTPMAQLWDDPAKYQRCVAQEQIGAKKRLKPIVKETKPNDQSFGKASKERA